MWEQVISPLWSWFSDRRKQRRERARASATALAYVASILKMQDQLQHKGLYRRWLKEGLPKDRLPQILGAEEVPKDEIKTAIIGQLGSLDRNDATDMVEFFRMLESIDIGTRQMAKFDGVDLRELVENHVAMMDRMMELGRELVRRLGESSR